MTTDERKHIITILTNIIAGRYTLSGIIDMAKSIIIILEKAEDK